MKEISDTKAARTRQRIIEHAAPIFNKKGVAGTSIEDVLKAANVAKGCLYGHFESKEALSHATVDFMLQKVLDRRSAFLAAETTAKGKIIAFMDYHKNPLSSFFTGGCPILNLGTESDDTCPIIRAKVKAVIDGTVKTFSGIARQGIDAGEFLPGLDPQAFVVKMFAALEGGNMMSRATQDTRYMSSIITGLKKELESWCVKQAGKK